MRYRIVRSALLAPALLLAGASATPSGSALKCGAQPDGRDPVVAVDGGIVSVDPDSIMKHVKTEEILSLDIVCMDPQDSTFNRSRGVPVISIWTKNGPVTQVKPILATILTTQDTHFRQESAYEADLDEFVLPFRSDVLKVSLDVTEKGWIARATVQRAFLTCFVFDGDVASPHPRLLPRQPDCLTDNERPGQ